MRTKTVDKTLTNKNICGLQVLLICQRSLIDPSFLLGSGDDSAGIMFTQFTVPKEQFWRTRGRMYLMGWVSTTDFLFSKNPCHHMADQMKHNSYEPI